MAFYTIRPWKHLCLQNSHGHAPPPPHILTFPRLSVNPRSSKVVKEKSCTCQIFARKALCPTLTLTPKPSWHYIRLIRRLVFLVINFFSIRHLRGWSANRKYPYTLHTYTDCIFISSYLPLFFASLDINSFYSCTTVLSSGVTSPILLL